MPAEEAITVLGLGLEIVGIVLLFFVAPEKYPDPQYGVTFAIQSNKRKVWQQTQTKRQLLAGVSILSIILGFVLQALPLAFP